MNNLLPRIPGYAQGIVGVDPFVLQCSGCAATHTMAPGERPSVVGAFGAWRFHHHDKDGRRCPSCLADAIAACCGGDGDEVAHLRSLAGKFPADVVDRVGEDK